MDAQAEPTLIELIRYNNWANQALLKTCQKLSEAQLSTGMEGAYGTILETLVHIIRAESGYLRLLTGSRPQPPFKWEDQPSLAAMAEYSLQLGEALVEAARQVPPLTPIGMDLDGKPVQVQAVVVFIQVINHGVEHRTNITTILNRGLLPPPQVDGWGYLEAHLDHFQLK